MKWHREGREANKEFIIKPITHLEIQNLPTSGQEILGIYPGTPSILRTAHFRVLVTCLSAGGLKFSCIQQKAFGHRGTHSTGQWLSKARFPIQRYQHLRGTSYKRKFFLCSPPWEPRPTTPCVPLPVDTTVLHICCTLLSSGQLCVVLWSEHPGHFESWNFCLLSLLSSLPRIALE